MVVLLIAAILLKSRALLRGFIMVVRARSVG